MYWVRVISGSSVKWISQRIEKIFAKTFPTEIKPTKYLHPVKEKNGEEKGT